MFVLLLCRYVSRAGGKISIERILFIFAPLKSPSPVKRVLCISPRTKLSFFTYLTEFFCAQPFSSSVHPAIASGYTKFQRNLIITEITVQSRNTQKAVAPGTEGDYTFSLQNSGKRNAQYKVWFEADSNFSNYEIPLEFRISGIYAAAADNHSQYS